MKKIYFLLLCLTFVLKGMDSSEAALQEKNKEIEVERKHRHVNQITLECQRALHAGDKSEIVAHLYGQLNSYLGDKELLTDLPFQTATGDYFTVLQVEADTSLYIQQQVVKAQLRANSVGGLNPVEHAKLSNAAMNKALTENLIMMVQKFRKGFLLD
jgi:hypothetical protein